MIDNMSAGFGPISTVQQTDVQTLDKNAVNAFTGILEEKKKEFEVMNPDLIKDGLLEIVINKNNTVTFIDTTSGKSIVLSALEALAVFKSDDPLTLLNGYFMEAYGMTLNYNLDYAQSDFPVSAR